MTDTERTLLKLAAGKLADYLSEFPEHDQGDFRVWEASQMISNVLAGHE